MIVRLAEYLEIPLRDQNYASPSGRVRPGVSGALDRGLGGGENRHRRHSSGAQALSRLRGRPALECGDVQFRAAPTLRGLFGRAPAPAGQRLAPHPAPGGHGPAHCQLCRVASPCARASFASRSTPAAMRFCRVCSPKSQPIRRRPRANRRGASEPPTAWPRRFESATRFGVMSFLGTVTVFGTPNDVTLSELALEMLFPCRRCDRADCARHGRGAGAGGVNGRWARPRSRSLNALLICLSCFSDRLSERRN